MGEIFQDTGSSQNNFGADFPQKIIPKNSKLLHNLVALLFQNTNSRENFSPFFLN